MAFRDRFSFIFGRQPQAQAQRPEVPASHRRTVNVPGRTQEDSEFDRATSGPWNTAGHEHEFSVQRVGPDWGLPRGQDPDSGAPDVMVRSSTSNPGRPRTKSLGYSYEDSALTITFRDGAVYRYEGVTPSEFSELQYSWSTGKQMNSMSLDSHEYMRVG